MFDWYHQQQLNKRLQRIRQLEFPKTVGEKVIENLGWGDESAIASWTSGFRRYLELQLRKTKGGGSLAMPSRAVDEVWHAALLHTRWYNKMCNDCLGYFLHHEPFPVEQESSDALRSVAHTYYLECQLENEPVDGSHVPLLFAMDRNWNVSPGFHYGTTMQVHRGLADIDVSVLSRIIEQQK